MEQPEVIDVKTGKAVISKQEFQIRPIDDIDSPFKYEIQIAADELAQGFQSYTNRYVHPSWNSSFKGKRLQELMEFTLPDGTLLIVPRKMPTVSLVTYPAMTQMLNLLGIQRKQVAEPENFISQLPNRWDKQGWANLRATRDQQIRKWMAQAPADKQVIFKANPFPLGNKEALMAISTVSPLYATVYADSLVNLTSDILADVGQFEVMYDHKGLRGRAVGYRMTRLKPEQGVQLKLGDTMGAFLKLRTSDTGQGSVSVFGGVMVLACLNGMTSTKGGFCWRRKHVGNGEAIRQEFEGAILNLLENIAGVGDRVTEAMNVKVLHERALAHLAEKHGLSKTMVERIRHAWNDPLGGNREETLWGLVQAVSRVPGMYDIGERSSRKRGQERLSHGQVDGLENLAGNLLVEPRSILTEELLTHV